MQTLCSDPHYFVLGGLQWAEALLQVISAMGNKSPLVAWVWDAPAADQDSNGSLLFSTVGYHGQLFFGKPFIYDNLSLNPCQIFQSINHSYIKNEVNVHSRYKMCV